MISYGFEENVDYVGCMFSCTLAKQELKDHQLTLDMAKEIAMLQRSEKGKQARKYFIECENKLTTKPQLSMAEYLVAQAQQMLKIELEQTELKNRLAIVEAKQTNSPTDFYSVVAWCNLRHKKVTLREAQIYGRACSNLSSKLGVQTCSTPDPRFGIVKTYHADVLDEIVG
jgi:phage anti-repressor protein